MSGTGDERVRTLYMRAVALVSVAGLARRG
jgi:hypothetical protein